MITYTNRRNKSYSIIPCIKEDVEKHLLLMSSYIQSNETDIQKQRMYKATETHTAFKMYRNDKLVSFFYFEYISNNIAGISYYQTNNIHLVLFTHFIIEFYKNTKYLFIQPHTNKITFLSLVEELSIRKYYYKNSPLYVIRLSDKVKRLLSIYDKYKFTYEITNECSK